MAVYTDTPRPRIPKIVVTSTSMCTYENVILLLVVLVVLVVVLLLARSWMRDS
jgi:hypothetical protein